MQITITVLFSFESGEKEVHFHADTCGGNQSSELWAGATTGRLLVIEQSAYYNEQLVGRRNNGNMISSWQPKERLVLIGNVWGVSASIAHPNKIALSSSVVEAEQFET